MLAVLPLAREIMKKETKNIGPVNKTPKKNELAFYIYKWNDDFTTFVVAYSPKGALDIIEASRDIACPPELQGETLNKKNLKKAEPNFILTINSPEMTDEEEYEVVGVIEEKKTLN